MNQVSLKNKLFDTYTGEALMEWEVFRYPINENEPNGKTIVEFAGKILDEEFGTNTLSFFSQDDEKFVWLLDPEQKLSERSAEDENENEMIVGGPTKEDFDTFDEASEYMIYIIESLGAASFYYSEKHKEIREKKNEG